MNNSRALVSVWTSITDDDFRSDHLKLCFLWYDEILIETLRPFHEKKFISDLLRAEEVKRAVTHVMSDVIRPVDMELQESVRRDPCNREEVGYPRWRVRGSTITNYTYPEPENAEQFAHNHLLGLIAAEQGVSRLWNEYAIQQAEGRARVAVDAVRLWEGVNAVLPCMLQASSDEKAAMEACRHFVSRVEDRPLQLFGACLPSLKNMSWNDVVKLRKNGSMKSLREKMSISALAASSDLDEAKAMFQSLEQDALDAVLEKGRPRVKRVAIESVLTNLPGLPVNPFSLLCGVRDTVNVVRENQKTGWLYLLRDIRAAASAPPPE